MTIARSNPALTLTAILLALAVTGAPSQAEGSGSGSVSLRREARVVGPEVTLADIARLRGDYAEGLGELVVGSFAADAQTLRISMPRIRRTLDEQDVHWGRLVCRGAQQVTVQRVEPAKPASREPRPPEANPVGPTLAADDLSVATTGRTLRQRIHQWIAQQVAGDDVEVEITFDDSDAPLLDAPLRGQRVEFEPLSAQPVGRVPITLRRYAGDELVDTDRLRVDVAVTHPAVVVTRSFSRGQVMTADNLTIKPITRTSLRKKPLRDVESAAGKRAVGLIREGGIVYADDVRAPLLVRRGQTVTVRAVSGGVVLRTVGRAMDDAERGDRITLRNERTREEFDARVTGPQEAVMILDEDETVAAGETR